jgi:hypothetical protein
VQGAIKTINYSEVVKPILQHLGTNKDEAFAREGFEMFIVVLVFQNMSTL